MFKPSQKLQKITKNYCVVKRGQLFIYLDPVFLWAFGESSGFLSDSSSELLLAQVFQQRLKCEICCFPTKAHECCVLI